MSATSARIEGRATLDEANPWLLAGIALGALAGALTTWSWIDGFASSLWVLLGAFGVAMAWWQQLLARKRPCIVEADADGLRIDGRLVPREELGDARVIPAAHGAPALVVLVRPRRPKLAIALDADASAEAFVRALGLDASRSVARFVAGPTRAGGSRLAIAVAGLLPLLVVAPWLFRGSGVGGFLLPALLPLLVPLFFFLARTHVVLGADGVSVSCAGVKRFLAWSEIASIDRAAPSELKGTVVTLTLRSGEAVPLSFSQNAWQRQWGADAFLARVQHALEAYAAGRAHATALALSRGEKSSTEWVLSLRRVGAGANATHRAAPLPTRELWAVLESASANASDRAAAAVALSASGEPGARVRVRAVADAVAEPQLRVALEAASGEDEDALREALESLTARSR